MSVATLKGYSATEFSFANKLQNGTRVTLGNKYQYNVRFGKDNTCISELGVRVCDREHENDFFVDLKLKGVFTFEEGAEKETVHVDTFKILFPYARAFVTTFTANAGIPPIFIPEPDIDSQSIYRFDLGGASEE